MFQREPNKLSTLLSSFVLWRTKSYQRRSELKKHLDNAEKTFIELTKEADKVITKTEETANQLEAQGKVMRQPRPPHRVKKVPGRNSILSEYRVTLDRQFNTKTSNNPEPTRIRPKMKPPKI